MSHSTFVAQIKISFIRDPKLKQISQIRFPKTFFSNSLDFIIPNSCWFLSKPNSASAFGLHEYPWINMNVQKFFYVYSCPFMRIHVCRRQKKRRDVFWGKQLETMKKNYIQQWERNFTPNCFLKRIILIALNCFNWFVTGIFVAQIKLVSFVIPN